MRFLRRPFAASWSRCARDDSLRDIGLHVVTLVVRVYSLVATSESPATSPTEWGRVAQLGERCVRNAEAESSILSASKTSHPVAREVLSRRSCEAAKADHLIFPG